MRNKFVYFCSIKICASGFNKLLESIFCLLLVVEAFYLLKSCWDAWRSGSWLARGQVNMADEAKLRSPVHSTFEALVVGHVVGHCHGELGSSCWPISAAGIAVFSASHWFVKHTSQMKWFHQVSESCSRSDRQQTTKQWLTMTFFGISLAFGSALDLLLV